MIRVCIRRLLILVALLFTCAVSVAEEIVTVDQIPPAGQRNLRLRVQPLKDSYFVAEPIYFYVQIENLSSRTEYLTIEELEQFTVADTTGQPLPVASGWLEFHYVQRPFVPGVGDGIWHAVPAHAVSPRSTYDVLEHFGTGHSADHYLPVGRYLLWARELPSDTIAFSVIEPAAEEDKQIMQRLTSYFGLLVSEPDRSPDNEILLYESLLEQSPRGSYAPFLISRLITWGVVRAGQKNAPAVQSLLLRLILDYPADPALNDYLTYLSPDQLDARTKLAVRDRLAALRDSLLDGRAQRYIDSLLQRLDR